MKSLEILKYLMETPHAVTSDTICINFGICTRTLKRYLAKYRKAGFYVNDHRKGSNKVGRYMVEL